MSAEDDVRKPGDGSASPLPGAERLRIGAEVLASDGTCGEVVGVIVNPVAQVLTHLVVAPKHDPERGRLVPIELVRGDGEPIHLRCTTAEFNRLDDAEDTRMVPASRDMWGYRSDQVYSWPFYGLGLGAWTGAEMGGFGDARRTTRQQVAAERVPLGEVEVRRGDQVHATDGWIGSVQGLVIDPSDHHVTHVLLQEGHLWGRKQVAIPIGATTRVGEEIRVKLTKQQVEDLPPVELSSGP